MELSKNQLAISTQIAEERMGELPTKRLIKGDGLLKPPGFYIKEARIRLGLSPKEVAQGICHESYLSKIENLMVDWDEENPIHRQLKERLKIESFPSVKEHWLKKYQQMIRGGDKQGITQAINRLKDGYQHRLLLLSMYVLLDMVGKVSGLLAYFQKLEPYLSVSELQLYYLCLGCQLLGYDQGYYLLNSLRLARYARLQDPLLHLAFSKYLFTIGLDVHGQKLLKEAEHLTKQLASTPHYIDCLNLSALAYLDNQLTASAKPKIHVLQTIKNQATVGQKVTIYLVLGLYAQGKSQLREAESFLIRSLVLSRHHFSPTSEISLISLVSLYSQQKKEKLLHKLLSHPRIQRQKLQESTRFQLDYFQHQSILTLHRAFDYARQNLDKKALKFYGRTLIDFYKAQGKYKKSVEIQQELDKFEHDVKTFQILLNESIQI